MRRVSAMLVALYGVWYLVLAFGLDSASIVNGLLDDSFYYLQVARNVSRGLGSTFDGIEPTNGYHPLWMFCLAPLYWIFGHSPDLALRAATFVAGAFGIGALVQLRTILRRSASDWTAALALLVFSWPRFFKQTTSLLETSLLLFLFLTLIRVENSLDLRRIGARVRLGILLGAICLTRLDSVFLLAGFALTPFVNDSALESSTRPRRPLLDRGREMAFVLVVAALIVAPYLAWNLMAFGHLQPISGAMKSSFPRPSPSISALAAFPEFVALLFLAAGLAVAWIRGRLDPALRPFGVFAFGALLQAGYSVLFMVWGVDFWHFSLLLPLGLAAAPVLASRVAGRFVAPRRRAALEWTLILSGVVGSALLQQYSLSLREGRWLDKTRELALWAKRELPKDAVVAATDTGVFAYYSERTTINLDGLINNYRYRDVLRAGRLHEYLAERGVDYILDQNHLRNPECVSGSYEARTIRIVDRPSGRVGGTLTLRRVDEVHRIVTESRVAAGSRATVPNAIILWRYWPPSESTPRRS